MRPAPAIRRALTAMALVVIAARASAQGPREPVLLELHLAQAASMTIPAEREGTRLWLPVADVLAALELEVGVRTARRVEATRFPLQERLVIDVDSGIVRRNDVAIKLLPQSVLHTDDAVLLDLDVIRQLLSATFEVSWADLVLYLPDIAALPVGVRLAREQARARFAAREDSLLRGDPPVAPLARPVAEGAVFDYTINMPLLDRDHRPGWSSALGLDVFGGSLEVSTGAVAGGTRLPTLASWAGVWRTGRKLTQLRVGDGLGGGPRPRLGRGLFVTNAPYMRPALFGLQSVRAELPPGWSLEAYRNGELIAVDTVGRGAASLMQLPVLYGENPVNLLAVGPFGQTRALSQNVRVLADVLPAGRSEYGVSLSQCRLQQQCVASATADLRVGLTNRWTMRMGVDGLVRDSVTWRQAPYLGFSGAPLNTLAVQFDMAGQSHTRLAVNWDPRSTLRVSAEQQWFGVAPLDPLFTGRRRAQSSVYGLWRSFGRAQSALEGNLDIMQFVSGAGLWRARLAASAQHRGVRWQPYLRLEQSTSVLAFAQQVAGLEATLLPEAQLGRVRGRSLIRALAEVDGAGRIFRHAITAMVPLPNAFRIDAGIARQRGQGGVLATMTLSRDLNSLRSYTMAMAGSGTATALQTLQGSAVFSRERLAPRLVPGPSLQRAGARGVVFLDRNANTRRDRDEPAIGGVTIHLGTGTAVSDASGAYTMWDLVPFVPLPVRVDSASLPSPLWVAAPGHPQVEIGPNHFAVVDIPVVPGGVVEGRLVEGETTRGVAGVPVQLVDSRGAVVARGRTFTDGEFVLIGVPPGTFQVRLPDAWMAANSVRASSTTVTLAPSDDGETARAPVVRLARYR
jgi:hypothetical protein